MNILLAEFENPADAIFVSIEKYGQTYVVSTFHEDIGLSPKDLQTSYPIEERDKAFQDYSQRVNEQIQKVLELEVYLLSHP